MALLKTEEAYNAAMQRIEELLKIVTDETPTSDSRYLELDFLSDLVEEYENIHSKRINPVSRHTNKSVLSVPSV